MNLETAVFGDPRIGLQGIQPTVTRIDSSVQKILETQNNNSLLIEQRTKDERAFRERMVFWIKIITVVIALGMFAIAVLDYHRHMVAEGNTPALKAYDNAIVPPAPFKP